MLPVGDVDFIIVLVRLTWLHLPFFADDHEQCEQN